MKACLIFLLTCLAVPLFAQSPEAAPKKDPFAGFGNTGLDRRRSGGLTPAAPARRAPPTPAPRAVPDSEPAEAPAATVSGGIVLADRWSGILTQGSGGHAMKMRDLRALLSRYGEAREDTGPHPAVTIYDGPPMDAALGARCRITYLMPLDRAEAALFRSRGIVTSSRAVAPGFPDGLFLHTYDVKAGIYNRLVLVTDGAKPQPQVVSLLLKAQGTNWYPPSPPWEKIPRDWHTHDYVNTVNRGQSGVVIDTRVHDLRGQGRYIVVNTTGGTRPPHWPGEVVRPANASPRETVTWYVPAPLIRLILYTLDQQLRP